MNQCQFPGCQMPAVAQCECCLTPAPYFCDEHGTLGGDRETEYGARAVPSQCWICDPRKALMGEVR